MENKERDALIESIYEQVDSLCDKLYDIVWEPQDPDFGEKTESNWLTVYKSIMNSINS